jgi:hypothetical protein
MNSHASGAGFDTSMWQRQTAFFGFLIAWISPAAVDRG